MTHKQKFIGIFSSPVKTFNTISQQPVKHSFWLIPLIVMIIVTIVSNILMKSYPGIQSTVRTSSITALEEQLDQAVEKGIMSTAQKKEQLYAIETRLIHEDASRFIPQSIVLFISSTLNFFIVSSIFLFGTKYFLRGKGAYVQAFIAYAVPLYILVLQTLVVIVLSIITSRYLAGTSIAAFVNVNTSTIGGSILNKSDPFLIWFYCIVGIGFAKMFNGGGVMKYIGMVFLVWIGSGVLVFFLAKVVPSIRWIINI